MTRPKQQTVGLIGIGLLGSAIAERLMAGGYSVWGFDASSKAMLSFSDKGGQPVARIRDVATASSTIVLCLPNSDVVEEVLVKIIPHLKPGAVLIDTTTGDPQRTQNLAHGLSQAEVEFVDASVLGSSQVTRDGNASLLIGASFDGLAKCEDVLKAISGNLHHVGRVGSGQEMKLVANLVLGLNRAALAEGLHFAKMFGLDLERVLDVLTSGATYSRVMDAKGKKMIEEKFEPQARLSQHLKDVKLILNHAQNADTTLPMSELHRHLLEKVDDQGDGELDNSAVIKAWT